MQSQLPVYRYAGLFARLAAWVIDYVVLQLIILLVALLVVVIVQLTIGMSQSEAQDRSLFTTLVVIAYVVSLGYYTFFWSHEGGGSTIGNRALRLRVLKVNGELLSPPRALLRAFLMYVFLISLIGAAASLVTILATPRRQALHDLVCGTVMLRV